MQIVVELNESELLARLRNFEDHLVERKTIKDERDWKKTAVAFANSVPVGLPAVLYIGVRDNGEIETPQQNLDDVQKKFNRHMGLSPVIGDDLRDICDPGVDLNPEAPCYGRFWIDMPEGRTRRTVSFGTGLNRATASRRLRDLIEAEGVNNKENFITITQPGLTFGAQAEKWLASLPHRRRRPVKPATVFGWRHALDKWILPTLGKRHLSEVGNGALRELIEVMVEGGLSAKTIVNYSQVPKMVVASALNGEGEQLYPRKWNHDFMGLPIVKQEEQHRPTITEAEINQLIQSAPRREAVLFALIAGTGLRAGEVLALKPTDFNGDFTILHVTRSIWKGKEQAPKTPAAVRTIDIPATLAVVLAAYAEGKTGLLFATRSGRPLSQRNVHRAAGHALHAFRRFRTEVLRRTRVPEDLIGLWLGHAKKTITDVYADGLKNDIQWRREWCEKVGLGFSVGLFGLENQTVMLFGKAA